VVDPFDKQNLDFRRQEFLPPGIRNIEDKFDTSRGTFRMTDFFNLSVSLVQKDVFCNECETKSIYKELKTPVASHICNYS
jgi:hypothetical protein